jgi:hypothetical protein
MYHGYYIPSIQQSFGDWQCSHEAKVIWDSLGLEDKHAGRFDGVSVWYRDNNTIVKRVVLQDFFALNFKVYIQDYPFQ